MFFKMICIVVLMMILSACNVLEVGIERTPTIDAGATATVEVLSEENAQLATQVAELNTPVPTPEVAVQTVESFIESPAIRLESWSPDQVWLAYWQSSEEDVAGALFPFAPGTLRFFNPEIERSCSYLEYVSRGYDDRLFWQENGQVIVVSGGVASQGSPCVDSFSVVDIPLAEDQVPDSVLSRDGTYRATSVIESDAEGVQTIQTTIVATSDNAVIQMVEWTIDARLGELGAGGEWVSDKQFLIDETRDRGPLLIDVDQGEINVVSDLFEGKRDLAALLASGVTLRARADVGPNAYHLLLIGVGEEANFPNVMLYHSENDVVEELPFQQVWSQAFSPDHQWLLLDGKFINADGYESHALFVRELEATSSDARRLGEMPLGAVFSPDWTRITFGATGMLSTISFPNGELLNSSSIAPYNVQSVAWSFDGRYLAAIGFMPEASGQALFVVEP